MIDLTPKLKKGDAVTVTYEGRTVEATVMLVDKYGLAGAVEFEAILGGYVGMMPVMTNPDRSQEDLLMHKPVVIALAEDGGWTAAPDGKGGKQPPRAIVNALIEFVGKQAEGAIPNGARIAKTGCEPGDRTPDGTLGTVKGSVKHEDTVFGRKVHYAYVVVWDNCPLAVVATTDFKVRRAE